MENINIYDLAVAHTIQEAKGDYLEVIANKRELSIICIESMVKMRHFLDRTPTFFQKIEREKEEEITEKEKRYSSLYVLFRKVNYD